jgi:very-short-patch-repair endonuclease/uncharacterized protein YdbL (DUF1318 family)
MPEQRIDRSRSALWQARWRALRARLEAEEHDPAVKRVVRTAVAQGFVISRSHALQLGVAESVVRRMLRHGTWQSTAHGILTVIATDAWAADGADDFELGRRDHVVRCAAAAVARPDHVASARSAAIMHGLPVFRTPGAPVMTARVRRTEGVDGGLLVRRATLRPVDETEWFGVPVTTLARTVVDLARNDRYDGVMAADAALRDGLTTREELRAALWRCTGWPGVRTARMIVDFADPLAESALESLVRLSLHASNLPAPELQAAIGAGRRTYRVDFLWRRQRLVLEADGRLKYTAEELWDEKQRELDLTRAGYRVERVVWADLGRNWGAVEMRLRRLLAVSTAD